MQLQMPRLPSASSAGGASQQRTVIADCVHHIAYVTVGVQQLQKLLGPLVLAHLRAANKRLMAGWPDLLAGGQYHHSGVAYGLTYNEIRITCVLLTCANMKATALPPY